MIDRCKKQHYFCFFPLDTQQFAFISTFFLSLFRDIIVKIIY